MLDREAATKYIHELLQLMVNSRGSDLFITSDFPPAIKVDGKVTPISQQPLNATQAMSLVKAIMNEKQLREYEQTLECNFAITAPGCRALSRVGLRAAGPRRHGAADHQHEDPLAGRA